MVFLISTAEQHELFGDFLPSSFWQEAARRWSGTPQWEDAAGRVIEYGLLEWQEIRAEQADWEQRLVRLLTAGEPAGGAAAMDLAEEQRRHVDRWYFTCTPEQHTRITRYLLDDASFRTRYESHAHGAARYLHDAAVANAARAAAAA